MKIATTLLLALQLPLGAAAQGSSGNPIVYPSGDVYGLSPIDTIAAANDEPLRLFIDYENEPDGGASTSGTMCVNANGDETCAFDVWIEMLTDTATFDSFTPAAAGIVGYIDPDTRTSLRVNGIDTNGMGIPAEIGILTVDALGATALQISVSGVHRVGAAGQLDPISSRPIVNLPEPGGAVPLGSALVALLALERVRRRRRRARR